MSLGVGGIVSVGGGTGGSSSTSGILEINGQTGTVITLVGTSGIVIAPVAPDQINIGFGGSVLASKFSATFASITSGTFNHGFNTLDVVIQVFDESRQVIHPDVIRVDNGDLVSVLFNTPQTGRIVIV